jgi:hypothetical protein
MHDYLQKALNIQFERIDELPTMLSELSLHVISTLCGEPFSSTPPCCYVELYDRQQVQH